MEQITINPSTVRKERVSSKPALSGPWLQAIAALLIASVSAVLSSPKWGFALSAWIAPVFYLYFFRIVIMKRKLLLFIPVMILTSVIGSKDVAPFPLPVLFVLGIIETMKVLAIYCSDQWIMRKSNHFISTLYFPAAFVSLEFLNSTMGGGIWWSLANTQFSFKWLIQLASVTGLWGISFLICWFASVAIWAWKNRKGIEPTKWGLGIYGSILFVVLCFGAYRYHFSHEGEEHHARVAGVSVPLMGFMQQLYKDYSGKEVSIDPTISISSPELQAINKAQIPFIEQADTAKFRNGYRASRETIDSLFVLSQRAADRGARIISWSEANAIVFPFDESQLLARASDFSSRNKVYLLMAVALIHPGKISAGSKFLENQALLFGPDGRPQITFHKNNPVPMAEASAPGDGRIPVISTPYGRIATSICYDADFPAQMRQLSRQHADLLLLPSGDWHAIAPYHSYMAIFRGIENGNALLRQASGGLSVASDYKGRILASMDFYQPGDKFWITDLNYGHVQTIYGIIGDLFAYGCAILAMIGILATAMISYRRKNQAGKLMPILATN
jgi:apolipoprotein N-acyltransferase